MKSRKECGRSYCIWKSSVGRVLSMCCLCAMLAVFALLLVGILRGSIAVFGKGVDVSTAIFRPVRSPDVAKFGEKIGMRGGDEVKRRFLADGEKFMYFAPHSGFNNQVVELRYALTIAKILNRTLIVPPVLDHHDAWLGSCPKRRVLRPYRLRALVWTRIFNLITNSRRNIACDLTVFSPHSDASRTSITVLETFEWFCGRYTSIADVVDISSVTPSKVRTIDLRIFLALWCGIDIRASCGGTLCKKFAEGVFVWREYEACVRLLNPLPKTEQSCRVFSVDNDCTSTIWTMNPESLSENTQTFEASFKAPPTWSADVAAGAKVQNMRRRALFTETLPIQWKAEKANMSEIRLLNIWSSLGPNSSAGNSSVLAFGSMFSTRYKNVQSHIDIITPSGDMDLDDLISSLEVLPFSSDIVAAGKQYILEEIKQPYFCAQLRLLDGQFKNHRNATFEGLKAHFSSYDSAFVSRNPTSMFVMTDLPSENWTKTDLGALLDPTKSYIVHKIDTRNDLIQLASRRILTTEFGFLVGTGLEVVRGSQHDQEQLPMFDKLPHVELAMEEIVCSCARLGFSGTHGSTIADRIRDLRGICIGSTL